MILLTNSLWNIGDNTEKYRQSPIFFIINYQSQQVKQSKTPMATCSLDRNPVPGVGEGPLVVLLEVLLGVHPAEGPGETEAWQEKAMKEEEEEEGEGSRKETKRRR